MTAMRRSVLPGGSRRGSRSLSRTDPEAVTPSWLTRRSQARASSGDRSLLPGVICNTKRPRRARSTSRSTICWTLWASSMPPMVSTAAKTTDISSVLTPPFVTLRLASRSTDRRRHLRFIRVISRPPGTEFGRNGLPGPDRGSPTPGLLRRLGLLQRAHRRPVGCWPDQVARLVHQRG